MNDAPFFFQQKTFPLILGRLSMLRLIAFGKIIDVGCSLGTTFGKDAVNLDKRPNEELIKIVEKEDKILYDWFKILFPDGKTANYVQADATQHIPFEDKTFDCAVLSEVIEHLNETETQGILKESGRVADYVIISVPNEWEWPEHIAFNKQVTIEEHKHVTFHTRETLMEAAANAGLSVIYYLQINCNPFSHHIMVATNTPCAPVNYRWGMGYGVGNNVQGMAVTVDEIISSIRVKPR
jgi:predicted SAM-dependent methyltransferase